MSACSWISQGGVGMLQMLLFVKCDAKTQGLGLIANRTKGKGAWAK